MWVECQGVGLTGEPHAVDEIPGSTSTPAVDGVDQTGAAKERLNDVHPNTELGRDDLN